MTDLVPSREVMTHQLVNPKVTRKLLVPEPHQWDFATSPAYSTFFAGGWGSGKSFAQLLFIAISAFSNPPDTDGLLVLPTYKMLTQFVERALLPAFKQVVTGRHKQDGIIHLAGGRRIICRSGHDPSMLEGDNCCWASADEIGLMKSEIHRKIIARVRDERSPWLRVGYTGVPLWGWTYELFNERQDLKRRIMHVPTAANARNLRKGYIQHLRENCPARLLPLYLHGKFVPPGATVFHVFDDNRHIKPFKFSYHVRDRFGRHVPADCGVIIDPSARNPHVLFAQHLEAGTKLGNLVLQYPAYIIFDEVCPDASEDAVRTEKLCQMVLEKGYPIKWCVIDPASLATEQTSGKQAARIIERMLDVTAEYTYDPRLRLIENGVEMVEHALDPLEGHPRLFFSSYLVDIAESQRAVMNAIRNYHYPEHKDGHPISNVPVKDGVTDHAMDCIRYLIINRMPIEELAVRIWRTSGFNQVRPAA